MARVIGAVYVGMDVAIEVLGVEHGANDRVVYRFTDEGITRRARIYYGVRDYIRTPIGRIGLDEVVRV